MSTSEVLIDVRSVLCRIHDSHLNRGGISEVYMAALRDSIFRIQVSINEVHAIEKKLRTAEDIIKRQPEIKGDPRQSLGLTMGFHPPDAHDTYWARWKFARCAVPLVTRARELGYNLIVHGSIARDIDMVAVPWVEGAVPAETLIAELELTIRSVDDSHPDEIHPTSGPTAKPHGRKAWSIFVRGTYFDISVIPTRGD